MDPNPLIQTIANLSTHFNDIHRNAKSSALHSNLHSLIQNVEFYYSD